MSEFQLEIYTPAGKMFEGSAGAVKLPSSKGEIGVLPGHVPYVGLLGTGLLELDSSAGSKRMVVSGGFISMDNNVLSILADYAVTPESVSPDYNSEREDLQKQISSQAIDSPETRYARQKLELIKAIDLLVSN